MFCRKCHGVLDTYSVRVRILDDEADLVRGAKVQLYGSVSLCAIGWKGHAACSLRGLERNAVPGMWIGSYQRAA
jgi:hypothetical protein